MTLSLPPPPLNFGAFPYPGRTHRHGVPVRRVLERGQERTPRHDRLPQGQAAAAEAADQEGSDARVGRAEHRTGWGVRLQRLAGNVNYVCMVDVVLLRRSHVWNFPA